MSDDEKHASRRQLTFEQAEGLAPLPQQMKPRQITPAGRAALWAVLFEQLRNSTYQNHVAGDWRLILFDLHVGYRHRMADEFDPYYPTVIKELKPVFADGNYARILGMTQWLLRHSRCPPSFRAAIGNALSATLNSYRIVADDTIVPVGSEREAETIEAAFADLARFEFGGAREHLRRAGEELTAGHFPGSVRESIHSVESVVRLLEPDGDFSKALAKLEAKAAVHGSLKKGFVAIYGFTSDAKGIRHPLLEDPQAAVDETDALFMMGACAAFVSYLVNKARSVGLLEE
jgi:hypothetical protein